MDIFVGNLSFEAREADIKKLFESFGTVAAAVIVMQKGKKIPKSRGFGFVSMPDEQQALAAIGALNGKDLMGRLLKVTAARPRIEAAPEDQSVREQRPEHAAGRRAFRPEAGDPVRTALHQGAHKPGTYRGGRRTRSFLRRRELEGTREEFKPQRRSHDNPMRWRKEKGDSFSQRKGRFEKKPWEKRADASRPWRKAAKQFPARQGSFAEHKPWKKSADTSRPWKKTGGSFPSRQEDRGTHKTWGKNEGASRPWKKTAKPFMTRQKSYGSSKPWKKPVAAKGRPGGRSGRRNAG